MALSHRDVTLTNSEQPKCKSMFTIILQDIHDFDKINSWDIYTQSWT